jgi:hypothetical protein
MLEPITLRWRHEEDEYVSAMRKYLMRKPAPYFLLGLVICRYSFPCFSSWETATSRPYKKRVLIIPKSAFESESQERWFRDILRKRLTPTPISSLKDNRTDKDEGEMFLPPETPPDWRLGGPLADRT